MTKRDLKKKAEEQREPMRCYTCDKYISNRFAEHCRCTIWDYGQPNKK